MITEKMFPEKQIENKFNYHAPTKDQLERYEAIRSKAKELAHIINESCPFSLEAGTAMERLSEAVMWANAAIARNENVVVGIDPGKPDKSVYCFYDGETERIGVEEGRE